MDDQDLKRAAWRSVAAFQRQLGAEAGDLLERDGFVASRLPQTNSSLINCVVPRGDRALDLDAIEAFFAAVPKWGVWLDPDEDPGELRKRGLVLDSTPLLMAAPIEDVERREDPRVRRTTTATVGAINDAAYDLERGTLGGAIGALDNIHAYAIDDASGALFQDVEDDVFVEFVATLPQRRGERLASAVMAHALREAERRGRTTTSLQASKLGRSIYARLGYRDLGEVHLYERRP